jgi:DivIVA domain-containing protein
VPWIELLVIAAVLVGVALMAGGRGDDLGAAPPDRPDSMVESASGPLTAEDVKAARFGVGFRGYRMDEVDALLDRLAEQLPSAEPATEPATEPAINPAQSAAAPEEDGSA